MAPFSYSSRRITSLAVVSAALLSAASAATITVRSVSDEAVTPTATDNDFTRLRDAIQGAGTNDVIVLQGDFDLSETNAFTKLTSEPAFVSGNPISFRDYGFRAPTNTAANTVGSYSPTDPVLSRKGVRTGVSGVEITTTTGSTVYGPSYAQFATLPVGARVSFISHGLANSVDPDAPATSLNRTIRSSNLKLTNLKVRRFNQIINSHTSNSGAYFPGLTMTGCDFQVNGGPGANFTDFQFTPRIGNITSPSSNVTISNNIFRITVNSVHDGMYMFGFSTTTSGSGYANLTVTNNTFKAELDPAFFTLPAYWIPATWDFGSGPVNLTQGEWPRAETVGFFDNSHASSSNMTFTGNTFDGEYTAADSTPRRLFYLGAAVTSATGEYATPAKANRISWANNTFKGVLTAYWSWAANPADISGTNVDGESFNIKGNTFTNCGWNVSPALPSTLNAVWRDVTFGYSPQGGAAQPGAMIIRNARPSAFGVQGPVPFILDLNINVNGKTGIEALHEIAATPAFFETQNDGSPMGIIQARVDPAAASPVFNSAYNTLPKFSDPDGNGTLAVGYNALPVTAPAGNPDIFTSLPDGAVITIAAGTTESYAPGTRITKRLTIRSDAPTGNQIGAPANAGTVRPDSQDFTKPLFLIENGGQLTLENLIVSGDSPAMGSRDVPYAVTTKTDVTAGVLTVSQVTFTNFADSSIATGRPGTYNISKVVFTNSDKGVRANGGTTTVDLSIFRALKDSVVQQGGVGLNLWRSQFYNNTGDTLFHIASASSFVNIGTAGKGNLFYDPFTLTLNVNLNTFNGPLAFNNNWHADRFAAGTDEASGYIVGDVVYVNTTPQQFKETNVVAQWDRDADGLPDAFELGGTTSNSGRDSDGNGVYDGPQVLLGATSGTFNLTADANSNGYADWLEETRAFLNYSGAPLGDVQANGVVNLSDAIVALQVVNGARAKTLASGDLNALNVTGSSVDSLTNPLQILRFQVGVRQKFPAVPGITYVLTPLGAGRKKRPAPFAPH